MSKIIVADASPLIAFARINQISLLDKLFGTIIVPQTVADECLIESFRPGAAGIQQAINNKIIQIHPNPLSIEELNELTDILDTGETFAIQLATNLKLPLMIDDKLGRMVATKLQIEIIGSAGILLLAKQKKLIPAVKPIITQLKNENYYLSDSLIKKILILAKE